MARSSTASSSRAHTPILFTSP
uniref:Uncharacterized protein n=1 Tax=Arabidopsis thaliana TaxID=3702 RepID=Q0WS59_ARATH|nr:hypothetical protein [Arabidopsis thaliana]